MKTFNITLYALLALSCVVQFTALIIKLQHPTDVEVVTAQISHMSDDILERAGLK